MFVFYCFVCFQHSSHVSCILFLFEKVKNTKFLFLEKPNFKKFVVYKKKKRNSFKI